MIVKADAQQGTVTAKLSFFEATTKVGGLQYSRYLVQQLEPTWGKPESKNTIGGLELTWSCAPANTSRLRDAVKNVKP